MTLDDIAHLERPSPKWLTTLSYARTQDLRLTPGLSQRRFGLADVQAPTASVSATQELVIQAFPAP